MYSRAYGDSTSILFVKFLLNYFLLLVSHSDQNNWHPIINLSPQNEVFIRNQDHHLTITKLKCIWTSMHTI